MGSANQQQTKPAGKEQSSDSTAPDGAEAGEETPNDDGTEQDGSTPDGDGGKSAGKQGGKQGQSANHKHKQSKSSDQKKSSDDKQGADGTAPEGTEPPETDPAGNEPTGGDGKQGESTDREEAATTDPSPADAADQPLSATNRVGTTATRFIQASDCPTPVNPCKKAVCKDRRCVNKSLPKGTACDDGDPCTTGSTCNKRARCRGGTVVPGCSTCTDSDLSNCPEPTDQCQKKVCNAGVCGIAVDTGKTCDNGLLLHPRTQGATSQWQLRGWNSARLQYDKRR